MAYRLGTTARNAACDGIVDGIDAGGTGTIMIRTTGQPTNVSDSPGGVLLGTCTFSATAFGAAATGVATAAAITSDTSADASGTAGHFVIRTGGAANHSDGRPELRQQRDRPRRDDRHLEHDRDGADQLTAPAAAEEPAKEKHTWQSSGSGAASRRP
jgi:hypothetical protein